MVYVKSVLAGIAALILSMIVLGVGVVLKVRASLGGGYSRSGPISFDFAPMWAVFGAALMVSAFALGFFLEFRRASRRRAPQT